MAVTTRKGDAASVRRQSRQRLRSERRYIFLSRSRRRYRRNRSVRFYRWPVRTASASPRFPRRFAPRNDKPEGPAPLNQWRKYCCSPRRSGNTATFFSRAAAFPLGLFPFTALHIIENYGIFSVKILTKKLRGDMLDLPRKEGSPRNELFCRHRK